MALDGDFQMDWHQNLVDEKKPWTNEVANQNETNLSRKPEKKDSKTEILDRLKDIKDIDSLKTALEEILWNMESQFLEAVKWKIKDPKALDALDAYDWYANLEDSAKMSVFEQKWLDLLAQAEQIITDVEMWTAEAKLLDNLFQQMSSELADFQHQTQKDVIEDLKDWMLSNKQFIEAYDLDWMLNKWWEKLFNEHNANTWKFKETVAKMPMTSLIWEVFSIDYWAWAFNDWYAEIKRRLNWKNLFQEIDNITSQESEEDRARDLLKRKTMRALLKSWKIDDLDKYLSSYKWTPEIKQRLKKTIQISNLWFANMPWTFPWEEEFLWDFVTHFEDVKKTASLWDIARDLEENNPIVEQFKPKKEEIYKQVPDVYQEGVMKAAFIFGNDKLAWAWIESFEKNIAKYKGAPFLFTEKDWEEYEDDDVRYITLKRKNSDDRITFALLKQVPPENDETDEDLRPESYNRGLSKIKDKWFNTFSLRCHCYNTNVMASTLADLGMTDKWSILIDGWCWNAKVIWDYVSQGLNCHMFSYTDTWKWATTEALFDHILKWKDKKTNIWELVSSIKAESKKNPALNWANKTMAMPGSEPYLYAQIKYWENPDLASINDEYDEGEE